MSITVTRLSNGLTVATDRMDTVESVALGVWVDVGARHETEAVNGVSHMLEHMAFKGTKRRSAQDIVEEVESVGGHINAYTSRENTAYHLRVLADDVPLAVDILSDILQNSAFQADELERERTVILQEIGQAADTPDDIIFDYFQETAYPGQALGRPILGSTGNIRGMTRDTVAGFMGAEYGADRMVLAASGKVDHDALVRLAEDAFSGLGTRGDTAPETAVYTGGERIQPRELEQVHLVLGFDGVPYADPDYYTMNVLAALLGGGMSSRLFQEIREKRGLVYTIFAFTSSYHDGGLFGVYAGTGEDDVPALMPVLRTELARIGDTVTDREIARVKTQMKAGLLMAMESTRARSERLAQHIQVFGRPLTAEELVARIEAVDRDAIASLAARTFAGKPTLTALGKARGLDALGANVAPLHAAE